MQIHSNKCLNRKAIYIIISKICLSVCVWSPFFSAPRYDRNSRPISLEPLWPEEYPSKKKKKKNYYQWRIYGQKTTPPMLFLWGKFGAICFNAWNENIFEVYSKKKKIYRSLKKYWRDSSERRIYRKMTSGGIIEEKSYTTNAFVWKKGVRRNQYPGNRGSK